MAGSGIRSFAKLRSQMPQIATTGKTPWQTVLQALRLPEIPAVRSGLWQSALKLILLSVAIRSCSIRGNPRIATIRCICLSTELSKGLNSSSRHFTSRVSLFEASYLFAALLLEYPYKILTRRIVWA
jgi:hypothetical protein